MSFAKTPALLALLVALPAIAHGDPVVVDRAVIGPRWSGIQYQDTLGWFMAATDINGDGQGDFLVAAPQEAGPPSFDSAVYVFLGRDGRPPVSGRADWFDSELSDGKTGGDEIFQFIVADDLTGDGLPDVLLAEPNAGGAGKVLLHAGQGSSWDPLISADTAAARWDGFVDGAITSRPSLVNWGDFNEDGQDDVVIVSGLAGRLWIDWGDGAFAGTTSLQDVTSSVALCQDDGVLAEFGATLAVGDFDADGTADLVTSAPGCEGGEGRVFVWYGEPGLDLRMPSTTLSQGDRLGTALSVADLNGDGVDDLFVQEALTGVSEDTGRLRIYLGRPGGIASTPDVLIEAGVLDRRFGETAVMHPDLSMPPDGLADLVVGSPRTAGNGEGQGAVYLFENPGTWPAELSTDDARWMVQGHSRDAWFGQSIAVVDDFDGDGFAEILVGEPNYTEGDSENDARRGRVYLMNAFPDRDEDDDGISTLGGDCDDSAPEVGPNQIEICFDDIDNDCDDVVDENCDEGDDDDATGDDDDSAVDPDPSGCDCGGGSASLGLLLLGAVGLRRRRD